MELPSHLQGLRGVHAQDNFSLTACLTLCRDKSMGSEQRGPVWKLTGKTGIQKVFKCPTYPSIFSKQYFEEMHLPINYLYSMTQAAMSADVFSIQPHKAQGSATGSGEKEHKSLSYSDPLIYTNFLQYFRNIYVNSFFLL